MATKLVLEESSSFEKLIYRNAKFRIYETSSGLFAIGDGLLERWDLSDNQAAKLSEIFKKTESSKAEYISCLESFGIKPDAKVVECINKLEEATPIIDEAEEAKKVQRWVFNIQCLDYNNIDNSIDFSLADVPEEVREHLAKEIVKHPSNRINLTNQDAIDLLKQSDEEDEEYVEESVSKIKETAVLEASKFYKIDDEEFYDYGTDDVRFMLGDVLHSDIFDKRTLGGHTDHPIIEKDIQMVSPNEYFEQCGRIFGNGFMANVRQVEAEPEILNHLMNVLYVAKKKFPMCFISKTRPVQEGRHRMYIAGKIFGWNKKFPVLVID